MGIGYDIEALTQRQKENEERIIDGGIKDYRASIAAAEAKGCFSETMPGRWLVSECIDPIRNRIKEFVEESVSGKPGRYAVGADILNRLKYDACAFIAVRIIVNSITDSRGAHEKSSVLSRIAHDLIEEMQYNHMKAERTYTYKYWMEQAQRADNRMTRKRCLDRLKKNFEKLPDFKTDAEKEAVAAAAEFLIQAVIQKTGIAKITKHVKHGKGSPKTPDFLELTPKYLAKIKTMNDRAESLWPKFEPMVCPPRPWTGAFGGGFVGKLGERTILIRTSNRAYLEDIHNNNIHKMEKALAALNAVQATPWRINRRVYEVMTTAFAGNGQQYGLPANEKLPDPIRPADIRTNKEAAKRFVNDLKAVQRREKKRESQWKAVHDMLVTAEKYVDETAIWFAHNLDWRGRIYPLSSHLSPQGEEQHRAILEFANGLPLETDEAVEWLAIHGAGCWGYDKVPFEDRVAWVFEHEEQIRGSAANPLDYGWWTGADKPWMFLAWCIDWVGYLDNGKSHISHLPVAMDGSCNGLQNFAAMLRHEETARAVNLVPSEIPADIYQEVADKVIPVVQQIAVSDPRPDGEIRAEADCRAALEYADSDRTKKLHAAIDKQVKDKKLSRKKGAAMKKEIKLEISKEERKRTAALYDVLSARWIKDHITRKLVKRPVMTYPYSVTLYGMRDQLVETLIDMDGEGVTHYPIEHVGKVAGMLKTAVFNAIQETVVAAAQAMEWLRSAAEVVAEGNMPVKWESPIGMPVVQNYWKTTTKRISVSFGGVRYQPVILIQQDREVSISEQAAGVSPNFVHSCDASHLMFTVLASQDRGIYDFHMIHDSYGTHARNANILARTLREQFVSIYGSKNLLADLFEQLRSQLMEHPELAGRITLPPEPGDFDLNQVLNSKYFFA